MKFSSDNCCENCNLALALKLLNAASHWDHFPQCFRVYMTLTNGGAKKHDQSCNILPQFSRHVSLLQSVTCPVIFSALCGSSNFRMNKGAGHNCIYLRRRRQLPGAYSRKPWEMVTKDGLHWCLYSNIQGVKLQCISDVKGSLRVMSWNFEPQRGGRNGRECKFQNKPPWTFHIRNNFTPVDSTLL